MSTRLKDTVITGISDKGTIMTIQLPSLRRLSLVIGFILWFTVWLPGIVWFFNACLGGRFSWWFIEASFLLLYSGYATIEILQAFIQRGSQVEVPEPDAPTLSVVQETVGDTVARLKAGGAIK